MENEIWFIDIRGEDGARKQDAYQRIMEKWIKAKKKPTQIMLDRWTARDDLIEKLQDIGLPVHGVVFRKI